MRPSDAECASAVFSAGGGGKLPRPAPRQAGRAGVGRLVLLGDPPFFDENDADPHCCAWPQRCSCRAVACGDPGVSRDMGRRPLVRRRWRLGSPFPARQGCLPGPATASVAATVRLRSRTPAWSRRAPRVVRRSREAAALPRSMPVPPVLAGRPTAHPIRPRLVGSSAWRIRAHAGASPRRLQDALASRKRHLGVGSHKR